MNIVFWWATLSHGWAISLLVVSQPWISHMAHPFWIPRPQTLAHYWLTILLNGSWDLRFGWANSNFISHIMTGSSIDHEPGVDEPAGSPIIRGGGSWIFTHLRDGVSQVTEVSWLNLFLLLLVNSLPASAPKNSDSEPSAKSPNCNDFWVFWSRRVVNL